jgi:hypothetical protein
VPQQSSPCGGSDDCCWAKAIVSRGADPVDPGDGFVAEALVPVSEAWRAIAIVRVGFDAVGV